jgi:hypothetical protein
MIDLTVLKPSHTQKQIKPMISNKNRIVGSTKKADRMVERKRERTKINRSGSYEPDRFAVLIKGLEGRFPLFFHLPFSL